MNTTKKPLEDFVSTEKRSFRFKVGEMLASSLSGFIAGAVFASIVWAGTILILKVYGLL